MHTCVFNLSCAVERMQKLKCPDAYLKPPIAAAVWSVKNTAAAKYAVVSLCINIRGQGNRQFALNVILILKTQMNTKGIENGNLQMQNVQ